VVFGVGGNVPVLTWYYRSHEGLSLHGRLKPLLSYPVEVMALSRRFLFHHGQLHCSGIAILNIAKPVHPVGMSTHEWFTLWAEDIRRAVASLRRNNPSDKQVRRFSRNLEVLEFIRTTWDAVLIGYQVERAEHLIRYHHSSPLNSRRLQGLERFKSQLVFHPLEAAERVKRLAAENRAWYFGHPKPSGRLLVFEEKKIAMLVSYIARSLPPAPRNPQGLQDLLGRLTSEPPPEPVYWRTFVKEYFEQFPPSKKVELFTMPSTNAGLGYPRSLGGHIAGVQHLVLLGYALKRIRGHNSIPTIQDTDATGSYLELLSDSLHPSSQLRPDKADGALLFRQSWDELEKSLPGAGAYLQSYLQDGVHYVLENLEYVPILPIVAEERGLKTRFPTCSLTAVNLVQQILRRVIDSAMIKDPRFSKALGATTGIDLRGEVGPWESQDCTAATDLHPQWLTQGVYEQLADMNPQLAPYRKYYNLLFGTKRILTAKVPPSAHAPESLFEHYPRAPLLDDRYVPFVRGDVEYGHASIIINDWNNWLRYLNTCEGVLTRTGQMMGDPTSFPPLMLVTLCAAEEVLKEHPYSLKESRRRHKGLKRSQAVLEGVGDDGRIPRWPNARRVLFHTKLSELGAVVSVKKSFTHPTRALIAEIPSESGYEVPIWPLSVLVAPPGGSKGHVTWATQVAAFGRDPTRPNKKVPKFFWKLSPYYYNWALAQRMGLPVGAPESWGGIGLPIAPPRSSVYHAQWLTYLSQLPMEELIIGTGLGPSGSSNESLLDGAARGWLRDLLSTSSKWKEEGLELLSTCALNQDATPRLTVSDGYRKAVSRLRSVEFYFRAPPELRENHAPSIRMWASKFSNKVGRSSRPWGSNPPLYKSTTLDLERKLNIFFSTSGGFLPDPWSPTPGFYGLEVSGETRRRWRGWGLPGIG